jgi:hypothetical protein
MAKIQESSHLLRVHLAFSETKPGHKNSGTQRKPEGERGEFLPQGFPDHHASSTNHERAPKSGTKETSEKGKVPFLAEVGDRINHK